MSVLVFCQCMLYRYSMLLDLTPWPPHPCFELTTIITLEYLRIGERANLTNVDNHVHYVFCLFHSQRSGDIVSESNIECTCTHSHVTYHWACTTSQPDASHWESPLHNEVCQRALAAVSAFAKRPVLMTFGFSLLSSLSFLMAFHPFHK